MARTSKSSTAKAKHGRVFVREGFARVVNYSIGREITLDDIGCGGHFGELAAIDGQPRSASVMALTHCSVAIMPQERFLDLVDQNPSVALKVMRGLASIIRNSTERIMDLSTLAANNRVQADLLRQALNNLNGDNFNFANSGARRYCQRAYNARNGCARDE